MDVVFTPESRSGTNATAWVVEAAEARAVGTMEGGTVAKRYSRRSLGRVDLKVLSAGGGIAPLARGRSRPSLSLHECEEISRGLVQAYQCGRLPRSLAAHRPRSTRR